MEDEVFEAMAALDVMPAPVDVTRAVTRLRAHGFSVEADVLISRGDSAWAMLYELRDALRRTGPEWCNLHQQEQISDEDLELVIGKLEDLLEVQP
jgi:hypothetical protein